MSGHRRSPLRHVARVGVAREARTAEDLLAALRQEKREAFARTQLYLQREAMPRIELKSPKIWRKLTSAWFAERVNLRYRACMTRAPEARR